MKSVFIDTSVLFSACYSKIGASALILGYCRKGKIQGYISNFVMNELKENALLKFNQFEKQRLNFYMLQGHLLILEDPSQEEIKQCEKVINKKDAPILASALKSKVKFLITLNTKDFMKMRIMKIDENLKIITPRNFVLEYWK